jgi:hypothetical protein
LWAKDLVAFRQDKSQISAFYATQVSLGIIIQFPSSPEEMVVICTDVKIGKVGAGAYLIMENSDKGVAIATR